jgi:hypothetical protein
MNAVFSLAPRSIIMNASMCTADCRTHVKIVTIAILAAGVVALIGMMSSVPAGAAVDPQVALSTVTGQPGPAASDRLQRGERQEASGREAAIFVPMQDVAKTALI